MKGMTTCKVCGRDFPLIEEEHYISRENKVEGLKPIIEGNKEPAQFDTFDCPHCGCQNVVQERKLMTCPCDFGICDECDHPGESKEYEGCSVCEYANEPEDGEHCKKCMHCYMDGFKRKEVDNE